MPANKSSKKKRNQDYVRSMKITFPVCVNEQMFTLEDIQQFMISTGYKVEKTLSHGIDPYFGRWEIVLTNSKGE